MSQHDPYIAAEFNRRLNALTRWYGQQLAECADVDAVRVVEIERQRRQREIMAWYQGGDDKPKVGPIDGPP